VQVVQGTAVVTLLLNLIALWRQEKVAPMTKAEREAEGPTFKDAWRDFASGGDAGRLLMVVFLGTMAFNMQDVLLEPYGGEILGLSVSATTLLTATWALGALVGFGDRSDDHENNRNSRARFGAGRMGGRTGHRRGAVYLSRGHDP